MTKHKNLNVEEILNKGLEVIKKTELVGNRAHLERYLRNFLQIYENGIKTLDMKIIFYQELYDGNPKTLIIPVKEMPGSSNFRQEIKNKIKELKEKRKEWIKLAENLPDRLPHLINDDQDFQKILYLDDAWSAKNGCLVLGMCICECSRYHFYKRTCLPTGKDFSILY